MDNYGIKDGKPYFEAVSENDKVAGMSNYGRWFGEKLKGDSGKPLVSPADLDGYIHKEWKENGQTFHRFLFMEYKPYDQFMDHIEKPWSGQMRSLKGFSSMPNCIAFLVGDPFARDWSNKEYNDDEDIRVALFENGALVGHKYMTIGEFRALIHRWWETGNIREEKPV